MNNHIGKFRNGSAARTLVRGLLMVLVAVAVTGLATAQTQDEQLKFRGGIGVITVTGVAANGAANLNIVRGVTPGAPWRIARLRGRGFSDWPHQSCRTRPASGVWATASAPTPARASTPLLSVVRLPRPPRTTPHSPASRWRPMEISELMISLPVPPFPCDNPVLLIRNVGGLWFAAGIPAIRLTVMPGRTNTGHHQAFHSRSKPGREDGICLAAIRHKHTKFLRDK